MSQVNTIPESETRLSRISALLHTRTAGAWHPETFAVVWWLLKILSGGSLSLREQTLYIQIGSRPFSRWIEHQLHLTHQHHISSFELWTVVYLDIYNVDICYLLSNGIQSAQIALESWTSVLDIFMPTCVLLKSEREVVMEMRFQVSDLSFVRSHFTAAII